MGKRTTPRQTLSPWYDTFTEEVRQSLKNRIDFNYELRLQGREAVLRDWCVALGALAWDISGESLTLLRAGHIRGPHILNRCIFDYWLRLAFYAKQPDRAQSDVVQLEAVLGKIIDALPVPRTPQEDTELAKYLARKDEDVTQRKIVKMLKVVRPRTWEAFRDHYYSLASILVHGNEIIMLDIFRPERELGQRGIDYATRRYSADDAATTMIMLLIDLLDEVERISGWGDRADKLIWDSRNLQRKHGDWHWSLN